MNFRKLELTGFKSFADKIELVFEPGTTAIVGPNGCGKSNICDAIKWVLGEQSARSLRCEKMEDVVFNGGSTRRPLGMAQVSLSISNSRKILPTDYSEVEISRRLFRSGESEYYMNKNRCLLREIQEMFMDTGLGANSYSLMEQGHIDLILNSSPQDRRLILEEAAGITKYRHRKRTSLRKLEATEQNLLRVKDILYELERQVESLKRQASKARRYQRYHAELKDLDTKLNLRKYRALVMEFKDTEDKITDSDDKMRSISAALTKLEAELEAFRLEITGSEGKLADVRTQERRVQSKVEETESDIAVLKERRINLQQRQQQAGVEAAKLQEQLRESEKHIAAIRIEKGKLSESISSQEDELKVAQERADRLTQAAAIAEKDAEELKAQTIDILNRKAKAQNELSATDSRLDYLVTRLDRLTSNAENFRTERAQLEGELAKLRVEVDARENEINNLTVRQNQVNSAIGQLQSRAALLEKNIKEIERERGTKASRLQSLQELQEAYEGYNAGVKALLGIRDRSSGIRDQSSVIRDQASGTGEGELGSGKSERSDMRHQTSDMRQETEEGGSQVSGLKSQVSRKVQGEHEVRPYGASLGGICGVIAEIVRTEPRYELAVEASLGSSIQDVVTETLEDAKAAVEYLKERKSGRATLLPMDTLVISHQSLVARGGREQGARERVSPSQSSLPDGVLAAASQVVDFDARYSPVVEYLLGNTLIVKDLDTAVKLAVAARAHATTGRDAYATISGDACATNHVPVNFATLDGQVVSSAGAITGGTGSEGAGLLRRSREIRDLREEVAELDEQLADLLKDRDSVVSKISSLQREKEEIAKELQRKQISHTSVQKDMSQCEQRLARLGKELSVVESECDALEKEIVTLEESKARLAGESAELEKQSEEINRKIGALQVEVRSKVQQRDAVVQQCTNIKVQLASKKQQEKGLGERLKSLEQERDRLLQTLSSRQTSASSDGEAEKEIAGKISVQEKTLEELFRERSRMEREISRLEAQRQKGQGDLAQGEALLREHRRNLDQLNQGKYQLEVTKTQLQMNIDSLVSRMRERYGVSLDEALNVKRQTSSVKRQASNVEREAEASDDSEADEDELTDRIEELRARMEKMGSVNLTAIDEYNRQKERYDLLVAQREDLLKAKDSLYNIIQRINRESRERLRKTFDSVNGGFQELFKRLFGGGQAELVMVSDGDVLESGVEIIARPPGKKQQAISMLSTGERSLTAIALLFALFKTKPSPFCVLDEVDAALDDANVGRFTDMVREFSIETQFIIITHNKRTMEMADVLYGVTMEESGVSKLVSLRMSDGDKASRLAS